MANHINSQVRAVNRKLNRLKLPVKKGASRALNTVAGRIKSRVVKAVAADKNVKQKNVRKRVYISKSNPKKLEARVVAYQADIPVISVGARQLKRGGVSSYKRRYPNAFIADGSKGYGKYRKGGEGRKGRFDGTKLATRHVLVRTTSERYPLEVVKISIKPSLRRHAPKIARQQMREHYPRIAESAIDDQVKKYAKR